MINIKDKSISIRAQCDDLEISRSGYYHEPAGETEYNLELMNLIDAE